jgi:glycosyltransferase involved in cell wall biosynthesis
VANVSQANRRQPSSHFVTVIVPTFRHPESLRETLVSLSGMDYPPDRWEVVVVDDGSGDETPDVVAAFTARQPTIRYHAQPNRGVASARNEGARRASGEVLLFVDDDMIVPPSLISDHLAALDHFAPAAISGYRMFAPDLTARLAETPFGRFRLEAEPRQEWGAEPISRDGSFPEICRPHNDGGLTSNNLSMYRSDFFRVGGFDEQFPSVGYEDLELAERAARTGLSCRIHFGILTWHNDRRLTLTQFLDRQRGNARGAVLFACKYPQYRNRSVYRENEPIRRSDPPRLLIKKLAKRAVATRPGRSLLMTLIGALERTAPNGAVLQRLYNIATGVAIFRGIREGLAAYEHKAGVATATLIVDQNVGAHR